MSKYGIKIKNFEAASIYEYQYGFRNKLDSTNAMLTNSLFLDFLLDNGLNIYKEESTRDVICVQFGYKTKGYEDMKSMILTHISKNSNEVIKAQLKEQLENIESNKEHCIEISKNDLRIKFYTEGFSITYRTYTKTGKEIDSKRQTIRYKMLYRTPGKAKKGTCMFINEDLYDKAHEFLYMGIQLPKKMHQLLKLVHMHHLLLLLLLEKYKSNQNKY